MRIWHVVGLALATGIAVVVTGCDCVPESDEELCGDQYCGQTTLVDDCGDERDVDCGDCPRTEDNCEDNQCVCQPESDDELCSQAGAECGETTVVDRCGDSQTVECGDCADTHECVANECLCEGETDAELCDEHDLECSTATVEDACGDDRTVDCGDCPGPDECEGNSCACVGEDDDQLCAEYDLECGTATVEDRCGDERTVACGDCTSPDECEDNTCECVGEDDDQLCAAAGACGTIETTDRCDQTRQLDCGDCPVGNTTFGTVRDGETGQAVEGAEIRVYEWPPAGRDSSWEWPAGHRENSPDKSTTTSDGPGDFNFEFATRESICMDDQVDGFEPHDWYRIVVDHPDYDPGHFYRPHPGYETGDCPETCPTDDDNGCARQDFEIFQSDSDYRQYPNLISDPRELDINEYQCADLPAGADHDRVVGLRIRAGGANIGPGPFHLEGDADNNRVLQHVETADGSVHTYGVDSRFYDHDAHGHIHFMAWIRLALIESVDECRDVDDRPDDCVTHGDLKISYCLHDLEPFDGDVATEYGGEMSLFPDPPVCDTNEQGVTQGWIDTYNRHLPGQVVVIGPPSEVSDIDTRFIEAEVDPERVLHERERDGNVAHWPIDLPDDGQALCEDSDKYLDCSADESDWGRTQERHCPDYLEHYGLD